MPTAAHHRLARAQERLVELNAQPAQLPLMLSEHEAAAMAAEEIRRADMLVAAVGWASMIDAKRRRATGS